MTTTTATTKKKRNEYRNNNSSSRSRSSSENTEKQQLNFIGTENSRNSIHIFGNAFVSFDSHKHIFRLVLDSFCMTCLSLENIRLLLTLPMLCFSFSFNFSFGLHCLRHLSYGPVCMLLLLLLLAEKHSRMYVVCLSSFTITKPERITICSALVRCLCFHPRQISLSFFRTFALVDVLCL